MYLPRFLPYVDVPLAIAIYALALSGTIVWLRTADGSQDTQRFLSEKSIALRILVIVLGLFLLCYGMDVAFWLLVLSLALSFAAAPFFGGESGGLIAGPLLLAALAIKEFVLGFPTLILRPEPNSLPKAVESIHDPLIGKRAVTISDLRPFGSIEYEGRLLQAVSKSKGFIPSNTDVLITSTEKNICIVEETT